LVYRKRSRPAEGFATGQDFASTGSEAISMAPNQIVPQQISVAVAILYRVS
jgi:hypothetical protein